MSIGDPPCYHGLNCQCFVNNTGGRYVLSHKTISEQDITLAELDEFEYFISDGGQMKFDMKLESELVQALRTIATLRKAWSDHESACREAYEAGMDEGLKHGRDRMNKIHELMRKLPTKQWAFIASICRDLQCVCFCGCHTGTQMD